MVNDKDYEKSDPEIETHETIEQLKLPREYDDGCINILDVLSKKEMNDPRVQAIFD